MLVHLPCLFNDEREIVLVVNALFKALRIAQYDGNGSLEVMGYTGYGVADVFLCLHTNLTKVTKFHPQLLKGAKDVTILP